MRPLNHKERSSLFWQFLFLFGATVLVLVFALNFDFELPQSLDANEKKQFNETRNFFRNQKDILRKMDNIDSTITQMETASTPGVMQSVALDDIIKLGALAGTDSTKMEYVGRIQKMYRSQVSDKMKVYELKKREEDSRKKLEEYKRDHPPINITGG